MPSRKHILDRLKEMTKFITAGRESEARAAGR
jgi:hypothetical protein